MIAKLKKEASGQLEFTETSGATSVSSEPAAPARKENSARSKQSTLLALRSQEDGAEGAENDTDDPGTDRAAAPRQQPEDLGFKVFKLAKPHIQPWTPDPNRDPETYVEQLSLFNDPLVQGWKADKVLWEIALREGYSLNTSFSEKKLVNGNVVHEVNDPDTGQQFAVCLDKAIKVDLSKHYEL